MRPSRFFPFKPSKSISLPPNSHFLPQRSFSFTKPLATTQVHLESNKATDQDLYFNKITVGKHDLIADEPLSVPGGMGIITEIIFLTSVDKGPSPYDYLLTALAS